MGFLPKRLTLQNLDQVSVFIEDTNNEYFNVQEVPETITQGRYAFKVFGSDFLREGIELKLELLDFEGNTIYLTPVDFIGEEVPPYVPYRYVTIEVYSPPINVAGLATLTILGEVNPDIVDVPIEFQNAYNVRYQKTINVDLSSTINTQPIRFFKNPTTEFEEIVQPKTVLTPVSESIVISTGQGIPRSDLKGKTIEIQSGSLEKEALPNEVSDTFKDLRRFKDEYKYKTGLRGKVPAIIKRRGLSRRFASLEEPKFKIKSDSAVFKSDMQGGTIEIPERTVTIVKTDSQTGRAIEEVVTVPKFKTKILEVIDENTIVPEEPPTVPLPTGSQPVGTDIQEVTIEDFSNTPITASFNVTDTSPSQSSVHFDSMLDLTIKDMRTFSGDIYRIRVHGNSEAAGNDFTVLSDVIVESPELLVDKDSSSGTLRTGYFINQSHINTYWNTFSINESVKSTKVSATHTGSQFIDSLLISGSTSGLNESVVIETKPLKSFTLRKDVAYTLSAKVKGKTTQKVISSDGSKSRKGKLFFHLSGSNLNTSQIITSHTNFGSELTDEATSEPVVLQLDEDVDGIQNFETIEHTFKPRFKLDKTVSTDTILQIRAESGEWFISDISLRPAMDTGFSPDEFNLKVPIPRSTRPDRFDFLIEYFDINNNVAETVTVLQDVPISGSALVIDGDGNLLTGSMFMGNALDSGIEMAGVNSAFMRSVGYEGFESASLAGKGGFMIFSGSVLPDAPDNYEGAGIEIHDGVIGDDESFLKFRTNPSVFDVKTSKFFLGGSNQFISGSNGNIEISSSKFHIQPDGDIVVREIQADTGTVGGFDIDDGSLKAGTGNSAITMSATEKIISMGSGSTFDKGSLQGGFRVGIDTDGQFKFAIGNAGSFIHADESGVSIKSDSFVVTASVAEIDVDVYKLSANNLFISSSGGGFISAGNPRPTGINGTNKGIFLRGNPAAALIGDANGSHIKFDGTTTSISSSEFVLGGSDNFISASLGNIKIFNTGETTLSGSSVNIQTPKFFLGGNSQFVSGSNGNVEISSSNFHLDNDGNVTMQGTITATAGEIGGFSVTDDALSSNNFLISGSSTGNNFFISSSNFNVKATGDVTASALDLTGGSVGGLTVSTGVVSVGEILKLKDSGQITGSQVLFTGGKIGGFTVDSDEIKTTELLIDSSNQRITLGASNSIKLQGGSDSFISMGNKSTFSNEGTGTSGIIIGMDSTNPQAEFVKDANNYFIFDDGIDIKTDTLRASGSNIVLEAPRFFLGGNTNFISGSNNNLRIFSSGNTTLSGSQVRIETPKFFMGGTQQFLSGSNGNLEISSSGFHLTPQGDVSASNILLGNKSIGDFLEFVDGVLTVQGEVSANAINTPALAPTPSASITADGFASFVSASIANFEVSTDEIKSSNESLRLKSGGQITGSNVLFSGGTIGGWTINSTNFASSGGGGIRLNSNGNNAEISINSHSFGNEGIQLGFNSGAPRFYVGDGGQNFLKYTTSGGVDIKTIKFELDTPGLEISSAVPSMSLGTSQEIMMRGVSNSPYIALQPSVALVDKAFGEIGVFFGVAGGSTPLFSAVGSGGHLKFNGSTIDINTNTAVISGSSIRLETPKFFLGGSGQFVSGSNGNVEISSSNFHLDNQGNVVMSGNITATTGDIGGFTIGDDLSNSGGSTLKLKGSSGQITASAAQITGDITANTITANTAGTIANFQISSAEIKSSNNILRLKSNGQISASQAQITGKITATSGQIAGFTIDGNQLTATNFALDASGKSISLGTGDTIFIADADTGIQLGDSTFADAPFSVTTAGVLKSVSGTIGGWTLGSNTIVGNNLTLNSSGLIETNDFASGVKGFRLDSSDNGTAEFENISIRGTLKTTVFEKETVNAVGGQLYVANSTTLTGSLAISASAATMSVVNVSGFTGSYSNDGEILVAKKITDTGFSTEYILVQSASRDEPNSDTNFAGKLYVVRGYNSGSSGDFLGDNANQSQSLSPGQVLASTGRIGTGYIRLNANPNDTTTPFIDIVERTGSGVYDVDLKARLGDLSGLSTDRLHGTNPANAGFGLYSQNVFLEGGIVANTGSIAGIEMESSKLYTGTGTHGNSNTGFYIDSGSKFSLGDKLVWDGSTLTVEGAINITGGGAVADQLAALNTATGSLQNDINTVESNVSGAFTEASSSLASDIVTVESNVSGAFTSVSESIAEKLITDSKGLLLDIPNSPSGQGLFLNHPYMGFYDNSEFTAFISASGGFLFKADDNNLISFGQSVTGGDGLSTKSFVLKSDNVFLSGSKVNILGEKFFLGGQSQFVSGSNGNIEISSSNFHLDRSGNVDMSGKITSTEGTIGGFDIGSTQISSSNGGLILNADGGITGSKFKLEGGIITADVTIEGDLSANSISTPTGGSPTAQITAQGFARFVSASIGGFNVSDNQINDNDEDLVLKSTGEITASNAQISGDITITGGSAKSHLEALGEQTASLDSSIEALGQTTASLNSATASLQSNIDTVETNVSGAFTDTSASIASSVNTVQSNLDSGLASVSSSVSGAFTSTSASIVSTITEVSSSTVERIMTDATGSILQVPPSPAGSGLYLNFPHLGFYDGAEPSSTTYTVTAPGGSGGGYYIDGVQRATVELQVGYTYRFDTSDGSMGSHPFRFSTDSGNSSQYTTGVTVGSGYVDIIVTSSTPSTLYYYCTNHGGMGGQVNVVDNSEYKAFISASGGFLFKADNNNLISFGQSVSGGDGTDTKSFVLRSDNVFLSGSNVNILGERFFLGGSNQFVSGSNGNIEISSSKFHVQPDGDVVMNDITASNALISGNITITGGSAKQHLEALGDQTASLDSSIESLGQTTASLNSATASLQSNIDTVEANVSGAFSETSASIASDINTVETNVSGAFTATSESIAERLITDSKGLLLDIPNSPSGEGLYLNYPYVGFYDAPTITDTTYVVTAPGGSSGGYYIDGVQRATVELQVGYTYRFDTSDSSNGGHPFRFSTTSNGSHGGGSEYTTGVTVGSGYVDIVVTSSTPSTLYYYCTAHGGMGGQINVVDNSEFKAFISASGGFLFKADDNNLISFGQSVSGGDGSSTKSFVLKSDNVFLSGSKVNILGERFFLGGGSQFVSGSNGNIEITSSMFHLNPSDNKVAISGSITATDGTIGNFTLTENTISSSANPGDGSTITLVVTANGSSNYIIDGVAQPALNFLAGNTYRFDVSDDTNGSHPLRFTLSDGGTDYYTTGVTINGTQGDPGSYVQIAVTKNTPSILYYRCTAHGNMRNSITIDKTSPLILDGSKGHVSASRFLFTGGKISGSSVEIDVENVNISGSSVDISTPKFFLGGDAQFISGSNGNIEISSSKFHLTKDGDVSMEGTVTATTGEIGGFAITSNAISESNNRLILRSDGRITASFMQMTGEVNIAGGSAQTHLENIGEQTASLNTSVVAIGNTTESLDASVVSIGQATESLDASVVSIGQATESLDASVVSIGESTQSLDASIVSIGETTSSLTTASQSMASRVSLTSTGVDIFDNLSNKLAEYTDTVTLGRTDGTNQNVFIDSNSVDVRKGNQVTASFGETTTVGPTSGRHVKITSNALEIKTDANTTVLSASAAGLEMEGTVTATTGEIGGFAITPTAISESNDNLILRSDGRITASFMQMTGEVNIAGGSAQTHLENIGEQTASLNTSVVSIGESTQSLNTSVVSIGEATESLDTSVVSIGEQTASLNTSVVSIGEATESLDTSVVSIGQATQSLDASVVAIGETTASLTTASSSMASRVSLTSQGVDVFNSSDEKISSFSGTVTIGRNANNESRVFIDSDSVDVITKSSGTDQTHASFGATTRIGLESSEHVKITSNALEIKTDSNTTVLSASSAGLEMEGTVKATAGEIGGFLISENEISSSLTPKRGLVLKPGDSISGFGNSAHTTKTVEGMFSFGVASVSPPVGSDGNRLLRSFNADDLTLLQAEEPATP